MPKTRLADLLEKHRSSLVPAWRERLRGTPGSSYAKMPAEELEDSLERGLTAIVESLRCQATLPIESHVRRVCDLRTRQGFTIGEVIQGFLVFKEVATPVVLDVFEESRIHAEQLGELDACLRSLVGSFSDAFSDQLIQSLERLSAALLESAEEAHVTRVIGDEARRLSDASAARVRLYERARERSDQSDPACFELRARDRALGMIRLEGVSFPLEPGRKRLLDALARQAGLAIEHARLEASRARGAVIEERHRLARDLHDSVTQSLYAASLYSEAMRRLLESDQLAAARDKAVDLREMILAALKEMRLLLFELHPPELGRQGLLSTLRARLDAVEAKSGLSTSLDIPEDLELPPDLERAIYYIATEALNNALKHARAHSIRIRLHREGGDIVLEVADDGVGFDLPAVKKKATIGLRGMSERVSHFGGRLEIASAPAKGTRVMLEIPLPCGRGEKGS